MASIPDAGPRREALDPTRSFCVSAPAGSGKTELLIQRYLCLLARVERPEQVLAITFTRKAAAEMRERVVEALEEARQGQPCSSEHQRVTRNLALAVVSAEQRGDWQLARHISRLNIKTIDSFCMGLTRQMPVLSQLGGQAAVRDDTEWLYSEAVTELYRHLDEPGAVGEDLAALLLHFDNDWEKVRTLLLGMLRCREQWRVYVAATREADAIDAYLVEVVNGVVSDYLQPIHTKLTPFASELMTLHQFAAAQLDRPALAALPGPGSEHLPAWRQLSELLLTRTHTLRQKVDINLGFPNDASDLSRKRKEDMKGLLKALAEVPGLEADLAALAFLPEVANGQHDWDLVLKISRLLPVLAAELLLVFQRWGVVDHNQVAESALLALGDENAPTELALRLDYQIEHILVDEFQDTSVNQYELLQKLTLGWGDHNALQVDSPRTLLVVGDAMQSIYGFRGANVGLFLKARRDGFNGVPLDYLELQSNFRSQQGIVDWVNASFRRVFPPHDDINRAQISLRTAVAVKPAEAGAAVTVHGFTGEQSRDHEARFIADRVTNCLSQGCGSIAILGRGRPHLQSIMAELQSRDVPFSAQDLDSLAQSEVVMDLLNLCMALANVADRLAWMALLRAPWCGLQLADLLAIAQAGASGEQGTISSAMADDETLANLSQDGRDRVQGVRSALQRAGSQRDRLGLRVWVEQLWLDLGGPGCVPEHQWYDAERFFQLLEQAQAEGLGLDIAWLRNQVEHGYADARGAECVVQIMTLHKAKGLEFEQVFIPQLDRQPPPNTRSLLLWDEYTTEAGERAFLLAADDREQSGSHSVYGYLREQLKRKTSLESARLLYVGATRAERKLTLTASVQEDDRAGDGRLKSPAAGSLLKQLWPVVEDAVHVHPMDDKEQQSASTQTRSRTLKRRRSWLAEPAKAAATVGGDQAPVRSDNRTDRYIGTVVHLALEELSNQPVLPDRLTAAQRQRWDRALQALGLWHDVRAQALERVVTSVETTLSGDGPGRWLLSSEHLDAHSEWALTSVGTEQEARLLVIDRTFIDRHTGVRWIVDYKNSRPGVDESLAAFTAREAASYVGQLKQYRDAVRSLGDEEIRCGLYFTALDHLHPLDELDSPAGGKC